MRENKTDGISLMPHGYWRGFIVSQAAPATDLAAILSSLQQAHRNNCFRATVMGKWYSGTFSGQQCC
jgi:hypothetical protein